MSRSESIVLGGVGVGVTKISPTQTPESESTLWLSHVHKFSFFVGKPYAPFHVVASSNKLVGFKRRRRALRRNLPSVQF